VGGKARIENETAVVGERAGILDETVLRVGRAGIYI
jgi:hypothetical protein